jgi:hypothetical protein
MPYCPLRRFPLAGFPRLACLIHAANVRSEPGSNPSSFFIEPHRHLAAATRNLVEFNLLVARLVDSKDLAGWLSVPRPRLLANSEPTATLPEVKVNAENGINPPHKAFATNLSKTDPVASSPDGLVASGFAPLDSMKFCNFFLSSRRVHHRVAVVGE